MIILVLSTPIQNIIPSGGVPQAPKKLRKKRTAHVQPTNLLSTFNGIQKEYGECTKLNPVDLNMGTSQISKDVNHLNVQPSPSTEGSVATNMAQEMIVFEVNEQTVKPLICQHVYPLNKSNTKFVSVGLKMESALDPVVRIFGRGRQNVTFTIEQWNEFVEHEHIITQYLLNVQSQEVCPVMQKFGFRITCEWIENFTKVLKISRGEEWLYLSIDGVKEVWRYKEIIYTRLEYLRLLNMKDYYNQMLGIVASMEGDLMTNITVATVGEISEQFCTMKEFITLGFDKIKFDYEIRQMLLY